MKTLLSFFLVFHSLIFVCSLNAEIAPHFEKCSETFNFITLNIYNNKIKKPGSYHVSSIHFHFGIELLMTVLKDG